MLQLLAFSRLKRLSAGLLFLLTAMVAAPRAFSQTAIVGYSSTWGGTAPGSVYPFHTTSADTVIVVPFAINSLGNYTLTSTSLLLRALTLHGGELPADSHDPHPGHELPGSGAGDIDLNNASIRIFSTLPTSLALPTSLVTYATQYTGASESPAVYTYLINSAPTFTAGQTYYLAISLGGILAWDMTTGDSYGGTYPGDNPVTSLVGDGTPLVYYKITSSGVQSFYDNVGGFAIAANAVTVIPEPANVGAIAASSVLATAVWVRRRRRAAAIATEYSSLPR